VQSWDFTVEHELTRNMALRVAYVGSRAYHEIISVDSNAIHAQICSTPNGCTSGGVGSTRGIVLQGAEYIPVGTRPNPYLANGAFWNSEGNASYNALQVEVTRRWRQGLQFRGNYTWSKNLDRGATITGSLGANQAQQVMNPYDPRRDWGPSALNTKHQGSVSFSYELPIGQGKPWLTGVTGVAEKLASGWQLNGIVTLLSGFPSTPQVGSNRSGNGDARNPDRPSANPSFTGSVNIGSPNRWFNPNAFVLPTAGTYGNVGNGVITGPGLRELDFSLFKNTRISERVELQFRSEFFNVLNHTNFSYPNPIIFLGTGTNPSAGVITSTATTSRQIQFGVKIIF